jgi:hypothetical protein
MAVPAMATIIAAMTNATVTNQRNRLIRFTPFAFPMRQPVAPLARYAL